MTILNPKGSSRAAIRTWQYRQHLNLYVLPNTWTIISNVDIRTRLLKANNRTYTISIYFPALITHWYYSTNDTCCIHLLACLHPYPLHLWLKWCLGFPAFHIERETHRTHILHLHRKVVDPQLRHIESWMCVIGCAVPTSAGVVTGEASLLEGAWEGGFPTALWATKGFKPDDDYDEEQSAETGISCN